MLGLADIAEDILALAGLADHHAGVHLGAGGDEQIAAFLRVKQTVCHGGPGLKGDQGTLLAIFDVALVRLVILEDGIHDAGSLGICQEGIMIADQAA